MPRPKLVGFVVAALAGAALVACSDESPMTPQTMSPGPGGPSRLTQYAPGTYTLSFVSRGQTVTSLPVGSEGALKAEVKSTFGALAQSGTVTFEYCSLKGGPPNDIDRSDEASKEACESGEATWAHLITLRVAPSGVPLVGFGVVQIPRTVGFRFRYTGGQASGIANGSASENFTWCPLTGCQ
jgi:hypothetical protein